MNIVRAAKRLACNPDDVRDLRLVLRFVGQVEQHGVSLLQIHFLHPWTYCCIKRGVLPVRLRDFFIRDLEQKRIQIGAREL